MKHTGRIIITGNDVPLIRGNARSIRCSWGNGGLARLTWYLEGLYTVSLATADSSPSVILYLDPSITGLNDTTFVCRATDVLGYTYQDKTVVYVKGRTILTQMFQHRSPLHGRYECGYTSDVCGSS